MWFQIQEMLLIEKGGEEQLKEELKAYNPLVPSGNNLPFTLMFGYEDVEERKKALASMGHVEDQVFLSFAEVTLKAFPTNEDLPRTTSDGKTSSIHFLQFEFTPEQVTFFKKLFLLFSNFFNVQIKTFKAMKKGVKFSITHPNYNYSQEIPEVVLQSLQNELN